jgi:hypothetical protein
VTKQWLERAAEQYMSNDTRRRDTPSQPANKASKSKSSKASKSKSSKKSGKRKSSGRRRRGQDSDDDESSCEEFDGLTSRASSEDASEAEQHTEFSLPRHKLLVRVAVVSMEAPTD